ncbi:elicitin-like protein INF4 [Phytophthora infestans T30-4]|uniref:Elicitin n=2 Tax=Phytophthora infestans TaxID=4787 RepID=D0P3R6_PHYIT|nr:elicitin-like protein INF4 [Phytophthora infestans T30-4]AAL16011.1 elicitin-like INF4 [Phytophthora infestans]AAV92916.1 INF4 [Phytophthora infestans]AAV92920.1 elicitin [Phytophthora infestans]EEY60722.1 elicitin-like protein INF4 [Phytophthora infestans T30-4]|eukprot:XP_002895059.1 elicitin-like protein INF4 [Phytophthora infestans T30-4]
MNFVALIAVTVAVLVGSTNAAACTAKQQTAAYNTLVSLLSEASFSTCSKDSGYSMITSKTLPRPKEKKAMCKSSSCKSMIKKIIALNPPNCTLTVPTSGLKTNVYKMAHDFSSDCKRL